MAKISVIVPFYNSQKTIRRCVDSILAQTYKDFEILLINDGSEDDSVAYIEKLYSNDARVILINKQHAGVSCARNAGLELASGEYIQFVDSDDYIEPEMFQRMMNVMIKEDADTVVCNYSHPCIKNYLGDKVLYMDRFEDRLMFYQNTFAIVVPWNKLYKKSVITDRFDEDVAFTEDELFGLANMCNAKKIVSINDCLYHYYAAEDAKSVEEMSCINKIARADDFWKTKRTYWYMRTALMSKVEDILNKHFDTSEHADFQYTRIFDFMLWELIIFHAMDADRDGIIKEMQAIFHERPFTDSLKIREKYGIYFNKGNEDEYNRKIICFVDDCINAYDDISCNHRQERPFYVCLGLFIRYFIKGGNKIDPTDIVARMYLSMEENSTKEAVYVNARQNVGNLVGYAI
jgi:glycosyltransferase involved in cell wall biosynthesis